MFTLADLCRSKYLFRPRPGESLQNNQYYRQLYPKIVHDIRVSCKFSLPTPVSSDFLCLNLFVDVATGKCCLLCIYQCQCQSWIYIAHKRKASNALVH